MKKYLLFLCCVFGFVPVAGFSFDLSMSENLVLDDDGFARRGTCKMIRTCESDEDDTVHVGAGKCYVADNDGSTQYCQDQLVCILGKTEEQEHGIRVNNGCWWADVKADDEFLHYDGLEVSTCSGSKKGQGTTAVFMTKDNKVLSDEDGKIAKSIVTRDYGHTARDQRQAGIAFNDILSEYDVSCVAYVCIDAKGNPIKQCDDGTCSCSGKNGEPDNGGQGGDSSSGGNGNGNDGGSGNNKVGRSFRNSVQPYLNALSQYK